MASDRGRQCEDVPVNGGAHRLSAISLSSTPPAADHNLRAHAYYCLHEDRTHQTESGSNESAGLYSNWDLKDRLRVVRNGIRNLGQQVMEVIILAPADVSDAAVDERFGEMLKQLVNS
ncbi:MAG: hypothetical protein ACR2FX_08850 [Chthoniobacterales bacterium]